MKEASYYIKKDELTVLCTLCPKVCSIAPFEYGFCMSRKNISGTLFAENYGQISSLALDPIEKKPLFRFMPGSTILSLGLYGCNMNCPFCQNHRISRIKPDVEYKSVEEIVRLAIDLKKHGNIGVAYTYNEPLTGYEYVLDCCKAVKASGLKNVLVSNGFISLKPLDELLPFVDAANIDLKCYNKEKYKEVLGGELEVVKNNIARIHKAKVHLEITMLIVPGISDDPGEFEEVVNFIAGLSRDIPLHLTRYFPAHNYRKSPTDLNVIYQLKHIADKHLKTVYLGNV
ncbi:MAG TPA: AmmeMemoRadiSam system radical SAM enzyme [Clostridiales bacterium]|nr:AmmeMemoRadiSam system radical SAM enzyme [Clostridiales bacterium]